MAHDTSTHDSPGAGVFGHWGEDAEGRPVYIYTIDHTRDPRALYNTSLGPSRDHWHQVGTGEFVATVHNAGYTQIYDWSRGGKLLNRWDPANGHFGGGFLLIELNVEVFSTLWEGLPQGATQTRRWGCNYAERETCYRDIEVMERLQGVPASHLLIFTWRVVNAAQAPRAMRITMPWWLQMHQLTPTPLMTHGMRRWADRRRAALNRHFTIEVETAELNDLPLAFTGKAIEAQYLASRSDASYHPWRASKVGWSPPSAFLSCLDDAAVRPRLLALPSQAVELSPANGLPLRLVHGGGAERQAPIGRNGKTRIPGAQGALIAVEYDFSLGPGDERAAWSSFSILRSMPGPAAGNGGLTKDVAPSISLHMDGAAALTRELRWHSAYLQGGSHFSTYHDARFVDQGSAYSYLQGLSGAPRDYCLFILPMVYLDPALAKDMLRHLLTSQHWRSGKLPYAHVGDAVQRGYVLHSFSSDLDLFLLWAASEYLGATRDLGFLDDALPYYPRILDKHGSVLDHLRAAFRHLVDRVGLGPHGLIRCGSGDWNDVLLGFSRMPPLTFLRGESSLNAGLAALALPRLADALGGAAPEFAGELRAFGEAQAAALKTMWTGRWAARGYLGYGNKKLGEDRLFLDTQAFGVLAGVWDDTQRAALFENIDTLCVRPQKVGALALWPPMKGPMLVEGSDTNGGTWAAIDGLLAWAWAQHDPKRAWDFYQSTTLAARAEAYPEVWYGVWSGPDSFNAHYHARPGETFSHNFTPMTDFPIMNMNRHAGPLLDAVKFAGIGPRGGAIEICPRVPGGEFTFDAPLISVHAQLTEISGEYRPICAGEFRFRIALPHALTGQAIHCEVNGAPTPPPAPGEPFATFTAQGSPAEAITWRIRAAD
jgi:hypothetical protein